MFDTLAATTNIKRLSEATPRKHKFNICTKRSNGFLQMHTRLSEPCANKLLKTLS